MISSGIQNDLDRFFLLSMDHNGTFQIHGTLAYRLPDDTQDIIAHDPIRRPIFRMLLPYAVTGARFNVE